jgi:hypothetical protein
VTRELSIGPSTLAPWSSDWIWSLPLILVTVIFHAYSLGLLKHLASVILKLARHRDLAGVVSLSVVGGTALCATLLHGLEAAVWAAAYFLLGALPNRKIAMLYSLGAMTTFGSGSLTLDTQWRLMGSLEALNGWILFGLTTAFLFTVIQDVWSHRNSQP